jgi:hypothetical protein
MSEKAFLRIFFVLLLGITSVAGAQNLIVGLCACRVLRWNWRQHNR